MANQWVGFFERRNRVAGATATPATTATSRPKSDLGPVTIPATNSTGVAARSNCSNRSNNRSAEAHEYLTYIAGWQATHKNDMPEIAPPPVGPPERAEVWAAFWSALEKRNRTFGS